MPKLLTKVTKNKLLLNLENLSFKNTKRKKPNSTLKSIFVSSQNECNSGVKTYWPPYYHSDLIVILNWFLVICLLCDHLKLVQSRQLLCSQCEIKAEIGKKKGNAEGTDPELPAKASYEEFVFEHQVTKKQAIEALRQLNDSFFNGPTSSGCKALNCDKHLRYCMSPYFLNDHCFCEQSHSVEGLPFLPHSCYVGEEHRETTKPSIGSCFRYAEIKECCCIRPLAKKWKYLSSASIAPPNIHLILLLFAFLTLLNVKFNFNTR